MENKSKKVFWLTLFAIICVHLSLIFIYGMQKEGYHEDEYYSFWSSSGVADLKPSGAYDWKSGSYLQQQFVVDKEERFDFGAVTANQVEDVHPPLYYLCLNMVMSLLPGRFFKWFSIGLNALFSVVSLLAVTFFFYRLEKKEHKYFVSLLAAGLYATAPSVISSVMLVRMYAMSGMWNVLYACALLMAVESFSESRRKFAAWTFLASVICYAAFLTHYFALLLPGVLTFLVCVKELFTRKHILRMLVFGSSMVAAITLAVASFPACIQHIFFGYRGTDVLSELNLKGFAHRFKFFTANLHTEVFAQTLPVIGIVLMSALAVICIYYIEKKHGLSIEERESFWWYLASFVATMVSVMVLIKVSLFVEAGSRYFYPVLALMLPLIGVMVLKASLILWERTNHKAGTVQQAVLLAVICSVILIPNIKGHIEDNVLFLYREDAEKVAFSQRHKEYPVVLLYNPETTYKTWYTANQLWPFERIFYTDYEHIMVDTFEEPTIQSAQKLIVYMDAPEEVVQKLVEKNPNLEGYSLIRHDAFYYVYLLE